LTLSDEAIERAGIVVASVTASDDADRVRIPGVVQPNAYREVTVTPLVGGRITRVLAELGQQVRRGQTMAEVYSPELAEAQTRYLSAQAALEAHERELRRTERLVEIGAASRQELERIHAEHTAQSTEVESARSRLVLLGLTADQISGLASASATTSTAYVPAPLAGVVTMRDANVGLNVDPSMPLFKVVDLSTVWVVGDLYERDFAHVRVGSQATITTTAYPDRALQGRVSYIDSQVKAETRTAQVRVEVPNPRGELRLGMYADMQVGEPRRSGAPAVPRTAVQMIGDRAVVYLVNPQERGRFIEREVRLGETTGDRVAVLAGLKPGDVVVTSGSFALRAERERLGLRSPLENVQQTPASMQIARVTVSDQGYEPSSLTLRAGIPARLTFVRTSDKTCGTEVAFPSLSIKRALPLNQSVEIEFTPQKAGEIAFVCGMNMLRGAIVVQ
jgi:RND family efflux transporter MFP subunit